MVLMLELLEQKCDVIVFQPYIEDVKVCDGRRDYILQKHESIVITLIIILLASSLIYYTR